MKTTKINKNYVMAAIAVIILAIIAYALYPKQTGSSQPSDSPTPAPEAKPVEDCGTLSGVIPVPFKDMAKQAANRSACYAAPNCSYNDKEAKCFKDTNAKSIIGVKHNCYISDTSDCTDYEHCKLENDLCVPA